MKLTNETALRETAAKRVDAKVGFLIHAAVYLAVNAGMTLSGQITQSYLWCAGAWTLSLLLQGISVFVDGAGLRRRAIDAELDRLRASAGQ